jgi:hypothetical protein
VLPWRGETDDEDSEDESPNTKEQTEVVQEQEDQGDQSDQVMDELPEHKAEGSLEDDEETTDNAHVG